MESVYFFDNLGTFTFIIIGQILVVAVWAILALLGQFSSKMRNLKTALSKKIFFNSWIVLIAESYVIVMITVMIQINYSKVHKEGHNEELESRLL